MRPIEQKLSLRASVTGEIYLDDCRVPETSRLPGANSIGAPLSCLTEARFGVAFGALGAATACLQAAISYTCDRPQFGKPSRRTVMALFETTEGVRLNYVDEGTGERDPAVVCVHGGFGNLTHWDPLAADLSSEYRVVRPDLRGHGRSAVPDADYSMPRFAGDVAELMDSLGLRTAAVFGHSMGAYIAVELAHSRPDLVGAVGLVDNGLPDSEGTGSKLVRGAIAMLEEGDYENDVRKIYSSLFSDSADRSLVERVAADAAKTPKHAALASLRGMVEYDARSSAEGLECPVLLARSGGHLPDRATADADWLRSALPQLQYAQVVGSGHFLMEEVPEQLNPMVRRFLGGLVG